MAILTAPSVIPDRLAGGKVRIRNPDKDINKNMFFFCLDSPLHGNDKRDPEMNSG